MEIYVQENSVNIVAVQWQDPNVLASSNSLCHLRLIITLTAKVVTKANMCIYKKGKFVLLFVSLDLLLNS